jgi:hypothetical protein
MESSEDGQSQLMAESRLAMGSGAVGDLRGLWSGELQLYGRGSAGVWRAVITDAMSGNFVAELPFEAPLSQEFRPFAGERLAVGGLYPAAAHAAEGSLLSPDPRFVVVFGLGLILLTLAAILGVRRPSAR